MRLRSRLFAAAGAAVTVLTLSAGTAQAAVSQPSAACYQGGFGGTQMSDTSTPLYWGVTGGSIQHGEGFAAPAPAGGLFGVSSYTTCFKVYHPQFGTNNDKLYQVVSYGQLQNIYLTEVNNGNFGPSEHFNVKGVNGPPSLAARWIAVYNNDTGSFNWFNEETGDLIVVTYDHGGLATISNPTTSQLDSPCANFTFAGGE